MYRKQAARTGQTVAISHGTLTALNNLAALCFVISERDKKVSVNSHLVLIHFGL